MSIHSPHPHLNPVFVGREEELKSAVNFYKKKKKTGGMLLVEGSRGSGKTRFLDELVEIIREREDVTVWRTGGKAVGRHPLYPFKAILPWRGMVAELKQNSPTSMLPEYDQRYLVFNAISSKIKEMVESKTTILVLDDIHLCDSMSIYLIHYMLKYRIPLVIFTTASSEDMVPKDVLGMTLKLMSRERLYSYQKLHPLGDEYMGTLVSNMLGKKPPENIMKKVLATAEGNPFITVQLLQSLISKGDVVLRDSKWEFVSPNVEVVFPNTIEDLMGDKLASLSNEEKDMLEICTILGPVISFPVLLLMIGTKEEDTIDTIESLISSGLITSVEPEEGMWGDEEYTFTTHLLFKLAYEGIPGERRGDLHIRAAEAMDGYAQLEGVSRDNMVPQIAKHYFLGGEWGKALPLYMRAGKRAETIAAYVDARDLYHEAVIVMEGGTGAPNDMLVRTLLDTARMALITGDLETTEDSLERALSLAKIEKLTKMEIEGRIYLGEIEIERENYSQAEKICLETLQDAVLMGDMEHIGWCFERLGKVYWMKGQLGQAREFFQNGLSYILATGDSNVLGKMNTDLGNVWRSSGEMDKALRSYEKALGIFSKSPNKYEESRALMNKGGALLLKGDIRVAMKTLKNADKLAESIGALSVSARANIFLAEAWLEDGNKERTSRCIQKASNIIEVVGGSLLFIRLKRIEGRMLYEKGQLEEAESMLKESLLKARKKGMSYERALSLYYLGKVYVRMGEPSRASDTFASAEKIFYSIGNKVMRKKTRSIINSLE